MAEEKEFFQKESLSLLPHLPVTPRSRVFWVLAPQISQWLLCTKSEGLFAFFVCVPLCGKWHNWMIFLRKHWFLVSSTAKPPASSAMNSTLLFLSPLIASSSQVHGVPSSALSPLSLTPLLSSFFPWRIFIPLPKTSFLSPLLTTVN